MFLAREKLSRAKIRHVHMEVDGKFYNATTTREFCNTVFDYLPNSVAPLGLKFQHWLNNINKFVYKPIIENSADV